jgi:acylpyruvate hydrolase
MSSERVIRAVRREAIFEGNPIPVGKIVCVGRNYARHIEEMGEKADADPVFFLKPSTALLTGTHLQVSIPESLGELHHEVELAALIGRRVRALDKEEALKCVAGYAVALDLTLRDLQSRAKEDGGPWCLAKGFDGAAPVGPFVARSSISDPHSLKIELSVNGEVRQSARTSSMIHRIDHLLSYVSRLMTLEPGDILLTGTPEGVGPLSDEDSVLARIDGLPDLGVEIARPPEGPITTQSY